MINIYEACICTSDTFIILDVYPESNIRHYFVGDVLNSFVLFLSFFLPLQKVSTVKGNYIHCNWILVNFNTELNGFLHI